MSKPPRRPAVADAAFSRIPFFVHVAPLITFVLPGRARRWQQDNDSLRAILRDVGVTMPAFKTSLLKHAISFDDIAATIKKMESAMAENNTKLDRMLSVRRPGTLLARNDARVLSSLRSLAMHPRLSLFCDNMRLGCALSVHFSIHALLVSSVCAAPRAGEAHSAARGRDRLGRRCRR